MTPEDVVYNERQMLGTGDVELIDSTTLGELTMVRYRHIGQAMFHPDQPAQKVTTIRLATYNGARSIFSQVIETEDITDAEAS